MSAVTFRPIIPIPPSAGVEPKHRAEGHPSPAAPYDAWPPPRPSHRRSGTDADTTCLHGATIGPDGIVTCQACDWCTHCDVPTMWTAEERCAGCGRLWGACEDCNDDPCVCAEDVTP